MTTRVLFVCLGNICRSPMAHGVFEHLLAERGLTDGFEVDSCGTGGWHVGEAPDSRTLEVLRKHGVRLNHAGRQLQPGDHERFDWIFAMDASNLRDSNHRFGLSTDESKVRMVLEPTGGGEVPDPYYGGPRGFDLCFELLDTALRVWLDRMLDERR